MSPEPITSLDSTDPSPYIRTYAKDVAALTGQKSSTPSVTTPHSEVSQLFSKQDDTLIVSSAPSTKPADLSQLERDAESINSQKESAQETEERVQDMGNAASSGILQSISLPSIQPGDIIPSLVATSSSADTTPANREEVLARLRAKVAGARPTSEPLMPSSFAAPLAYEQPAPEAPAPLPPQVPVVPLPPLPPIVEMPAPEPFHSFSSDFADRIDEQHASTFSVLAAEKDASRRQPAPTHKKRNFLPIIAGVILVLAGAGGVFAAYRFMTATAPIAATPSASYLIVPDEKVALSGSGNALLQALAQEAAQPIPANTVLLTYVNSATTTDEGAVQAPTSGGAFLADLNLPAPDILLRNIEPSSMVGIANDGSQTRAFFILSVDSYESTFAGMLSWEPTLASDLSVLYPAYPAPTPTALDVATSTASSTTSSKKSGTSAKVASSSPVVTASLPSVPLQFIDEVVANHNARALKDAYGRTIIIYGYADPQTLVIARDEAAFTLLLGRLEAGQH